MLDFSGRFQMMLLLKVMHTGAMSIFYLSQSWAATA